MVQHSDYVVRLAETIKAQLDTRGISTLRLSELADIPRATLQRRLKGLSSFTCLEIALIAPHLDMTPGELSILAEQDQAAA